MGAFIWGMIGGAIVLIANQHKNMQVTAQTAGKDNVGVVGRMRFCVLQVIEDFRDLVAESKAELAAEKASLQEAEAHDKIEG